MVRGVEDASGLGARLERGPRESFIPMPGGRSESEAEILRWQHLKNITGYRAQRGERFGYLTVSGAERVVARRHGCFPALFPRRCLDSSGDGRLHHLMRFVDRPEGGAPASLPFCEPQNVFRHWGPYVRFRKTVPAQCRVFLNNDPALTSLDLWKPKSKVSRGCETHRPDTLRWFFPETMDTLVQS